jgi:hypothetical protein
VWHRRILLAGVVLAALSSCGAPTSTGHQARQAPGVTPLTDPPAVTSPAASVPAKSAGTGQTPDAAAARFATATAFVGRQRGRLGIVIRDRVSGSVWRAGDTRATTWTASTIKLALAADLLERQRAGQLVLDATDRSNLAAALRVSSNDAATALWNRYGGQGMVDRFRSRYGMSGLSVVAGYDVFWRNLRCSAEDLLALMSYVLERLAAPDRAYLVDALRSVASIQHWGVWAAGTVQRPGTKDGWAQKPVDGSMVWLTHAVGFAGPAERYVVAVMFQQPVGGSLATGVHVISDLVATVFGAPVPASVTVPPA